MTSYSRVVGYFFAALLIVIQAVRLPSEQTYSYLVGLVGLEFVSTILSLVVIGKVENDIAKATTGRFFFGLIVHGLMVLAFVLANGGSAIVFACLFLYGGRLTKFLREVSKEEFSREVHRDVTGALLLFILTFLCAGAFSLMESPFAETKLYVKYKPIAMAAVWCMYLGYLGLSELMPERFMSKPDRENDA